MIEKTSRMTKSYAQPKHKRNLYAETFSLSRLYQWTQSGRSRSSSAKANAIFGSGSVNELCEAVSDLGFQRLLLVTDEGLVQIGMAEQVAERASSKGLEVVVFSEVKPDPTYDHVERGLDVYLESGCDAILALGGGSAMDCSKVIAAKVTNKRPIKKLAGLFRVWRTPAPLFVIPTTSGTGSEVTIAAVVSDPVTHLKTPLMDPKLVPLMAALDADLLLGLPAKITADTGIDALTHAVEAYVSRNASQKQKPTPLQPLNSSLSICLKW